MPALPVDRFDRRICIKTRVLTGLIEKCWEGPRLPSAIDVKHGQMKFTEVQQFAAPTAAAERQSDRPPELDPRASAVQHLEQECALSFFCSAHQLRQNAAAPTIVL